MENPQKVKLGVYDFRGKFLGYNCDCLWNWTHKHHEKFKSHLFNDALPSGHLKRSLEYYIKEYLTDIKKMIRNSKGSPESNLLHIVAQDIETGEALFGYSVKLPQ